MQLRDSVCSCQSQNKCSACRSAVCRTHSSCPPDKEEKGTQTEVCALCRTRAAGGEGRRAVGVQGALGIQLICDKMAITNFSCHRQGVRWKQEWGVTQNNPVLFAFSLIFPGVRLASDSQFSDFLDGLGPAQLVGRQTLATPAMGKNFCHVIRCFPFSLLKNHIPQFHKIFRSIIWNEYI